MAAALQSVTNVLSTQAIKAMRMMTIKYAPVAGAAADVFLEAAEESRQFVRDAALAGVDPLSEEEQQILEGDPEEWTEAEREVRVCYQTIRASRDGLRTTGLEGPVTMFSHWLLEVSWLRVFDSVAHAAEK